MAGRSTLHMWHAMSSAALCNTPHITALPVLVITTLLADERYEGGQHIEFNEKIQQHQRA
jgi:hypothetical protein